MLGLTAADVVGAAILKVKRRHPWFAKVLFKLRPHESANTKSMSIDAGLRLRYNRERVERWGADDTPVMVAHEIHHPLLKHRERAAAMRPRVEPGYAARANNLREKYGITDYQNLMNWAADWEINVVLKAAGWTWPEDWPGLMPGHHGFAEGLTMERYAEAIVASVEDDEGGDDGGADEVPEAGQEARDDEGDAGDGADAGDGDALAGDGERPAGTRPQPQSDPAPADGDPAGDGGAAPGKDPVDARGDVAPRQSERTGCGCCGGAAGNPVAGEDDGGPEPISPAELEIALHQVALDTVEWARRSGLGKGPGAAVLAWARQFLKPPKVDARRLLAAHLRGAVDNVPGAVDYRMGPPSRRREALKAVLGDEAPLLAVLRGVEPRVVVVVDTSGSMGSGPAARRLNRAASELWGVARATNLPLWAIAWDDAEQAVRRVRTLADLKGMMRGGGGTDMGAAIRAGCAKKHRADVVVLLSDGESGWLEAREVPSKIRVIPIITNETRASFDGMPAWLRRHGVWVDTTEAA